MFHWVPGGLTFLRSRRYIKVMAKTFLTLDFGKKEEAAQQARHQLDIWRQAFHLNKKLEYKFERETAGEGSAEKSRKKTSAKHSAKDSVDKQEESSSIRVIIQMQFSDHEKLSQQRWIDRIGAEEPFNGASPKVIRHGEAEFSNTETLFDSLD
jgi:hypothetical protein